MINKNLCVRHNAESQFYNDTKHFKQYFGKTDSSLKEMKSLYLRI